MSVEENRANASASPLYDADAIQQIPFWVERTIKGTRKRYKVIHHLGGCDDELYIEYERILKPRLRRMKGNISESVTDVRAASVHLYRSLLQKVEGWGAENGSNVDEEMMQAVIQQAYLSVHVMPRPEALAIGDAEEDEPWAESDDEGIVLRCLFAGAQSTPSHFLRKESASQEQRYAALTTRKKFEPGKRMNRADVALPTNAKALGKLYDELQERVEGYAGRLPLWHKIAALTDWMEREAGDGEDEGNE